MSFTAADLERRRRETFDLVELDEILEDALNVIRAYELRATPRQIHRARVSRPHLVLVKNAPDRLDPGPAPTHGGSREPYAAS